MVNHTFNTAQISTDFEGFQLLAEMDAQMSAAREANYTFASSWIDGNMCAPFGALIHRQQLSGVACNFDVHSGATTSLRRNGFLALFGHSSVPDNFESTIAYRHFMPGDTPAFQLYIDEYFKRGKRGLPKMSAGLLREFRRSLYEAYQNTIDHAESSGGVFACGQYFPKSQRLRFSMADLGIGFQERIYRDTSQKFKAWEAIRWALEGNTTKRGPKPGGLGLQVIKEFIKLNEGRIVVVSNDGYADINAGVFAARALQHKFPGTIMTVEINTADTASYSLANETDITDVF